jgi:hypothetical protein
LRIETNNYKKNRQTNAKPNPTTTGEGTGQVGLSLSQSSRKVQIADTEFQGLGYSACQETGPSRSPHSIAEIRSKPTMTQQGMTMTGTPRAEAYNTVLPSLSMQGIGMAQERREAGIPISNESLSRSQNLQPGGLLTTWSTQDPSADRYPTNSCIEPNHRCNGSHGPQRQTEQNPMSPYTHYTTQTMS